MNSFQAYQKELKLSKYDPLSPVDELRLAKLMRAGDDAARQEMIQRNLRFVVSKAKGWFPKCKHLKAMDIIEYGNQGLIEGLSRFDPYKINPENGQPYRVTSFVEFHIRNAIQVAIRRYEDEIRVPYSRLKASGFDNPVGGSLDQLTGADQEESLEKRIGFIEIAFDAEDSSRVADLFDDVHLTWLECEILKMGYGLIDDVQRTDDQIAMVYQVKPDQVRAIKRRATHKLKGSRHGGVFV